MELSTIVRMDDINSAIAKSFDFSFSGDIETTVAELPQIDRFDYGIGLIVGASGSGKSTLLRGFGSIDQKFEWQDQVSICSHFDSVEDAQDRLGAVGLNSIPTWMKPYNVLSNGEAFRADLAIGIKNGALIDEYTSVIDRNVAVACSKSLRKYVDRKGLRGIVLASCHYDIIEWLQPDWIFDASTGELSIRGSERRFPKIKIDLVPCELKEWLSFKEHHYLSGSLSNGSMCWVAVWGDKKIGFCSVIPFPNGNLKNAWKGHRTVVLPDYQGLGIGVRISDAIAQMMVADGKRYFSKTSHVRMGEYRERHPNWRPTSKNKKTRNDYKVYDKDSSSMANLKNIHSERMCYSHEYVDSSIAVKPTEPVDISFLGI